MSQKYEKLKNLLQELFQLDQPDLDFGLYRIMRARSAEITQFLDKDLLPQVKASFAAYQPADKAVIQGELAKAVEQAKSLGADPESLPKVKELRSKLQNEAVDIGSLESEVYDHLYSFFRRYYSEGDFISKRVYKEGVYAIPYEGEEVKLHWANADQYYIKTSEYLRDYTFRLNPSSEANPRRVHFRLADVAEGEHGNVKEAEGKNRVFVLASEDFISEENKELIIRFEYRPATLNDWPEEQRAGKTKPPAQKEQIALAEKRLLAVSDTALVLWIAELGKKHTMANGEAADYSKLVAHMNRYTARNTFDYFIHKHLGTFLNRELDFYIKNEVMHLDDVESETVPRVEQYLSKVKVIRKVARKIIDFLAQLEDFQKKLWLKKKFVVETNYCITLDRIPEEFYAEIAANRTQVEEWVRLFIIDEIQPTAGDLLNAGKPGYSVPLTVEFLKANDKLVLDTKFFSDEFKVKLIGGIENFDEQMDGLLIHSENFQALNLLQARYRESFNGSYFDPPYNSDASAIIYKNDYKDSSWLSLMDNRISLMKKLILPNGIVCGAIDDEEVVGLRTVLNSHFVKQLGIVAVRSNPAGRKTKGKFAPAHEYALFYGVSENSIPSSLEKTEKSLSRYPKTDEKGRFAWANFIRSGNNDKRSDRPRLYYPVAVNSKDEIRIPKLEWSALDNEWKIVDEIRRDEFLVYPVQDKDGVIVEKNWQRGSERVPNELDEYRIRRQDDGSISIDFKTRMDEGALPNTWWDKTEYASANYGAAEQKELFGEMIFDYPKAQMLVEDCIKVIGLKDGITSVLDFFGGSGTTAHSVINLTRKDGGKRKYCLIELGVHFDTTLLLRTKKIIYSSDWKDGKPTTRDTGISHCFKYLRLESYEDTLNNLDLRRTEAQTNLLDFKGEEADKFKEDYILRYMLDVESRGSASLLNIEAFIDPTAYSLKVKIPGSDESREVKVDLLETFNYLLGLQIKNISAPHTINAEFERDSEKRLRIKGRISEKADGAWWFRTVSGTTLDGRKILVIWRKRPGLENPEGVEQDNLVLDTWFTKMGYSSKDSEFDLIYVNGTNNLENLKTPDDLWKVRLIEEDFKRLMFEDAGV